MLFFAGFIQGLAGFGSGLIAVPALSLMLPLPLIVPMMVIAGSLTSLLNLIHLRQAIELAPLKPLLIGFVIGTPVGLLFLTQAPQQLVILGLGLFLCSYALASLTRFTQIRAINQQLRQRQLGLGALSGALAAAFSTSGPPIILHVSAQQSWSPDRKKALLSAFFLITTFITLAALLLGGLINQQVLRHVLIATPALVLGTLVGIGLYRRLGEHHYQTITYILIGLMGANMLLQSLWP